MPTPFRCEAVPLDPADTDAAIARDIAAIARIGIVPAMLKLACENTGMGFAAVARVTDGSWTACAVEDRIAFGLLPGAQLKVETTLCREARSLRQPIVIDHASQDPVYRDHHTPRTYNIESYISVPIVRPDGRYFGNLCAVDPKPAQVSDPRTVRMFSALADMIALQLTNDDAHEHAQREVQEQREAADLREQFIAVLGHDLRNPLAAISVSAELLARRPDAKDRMLGERLRSSARRMGGLIDNVLDFARARLGGGFGVDIRPADALAASLHAVIEESRSAHPDIDIRHRIDIATPVACDTARLQQLLSNLLGNAIHHGAPSEPIRVDVGLHDGLLEMSVHNRGDSIAAEHLRKIFQPYWRPPTSKPGGGLGLGLYICSEIVKSHGGVLTATSSPEYGTTFTARIPLQPRAMADAGQPSA